MVVATLGLCPLCHERLGNLKFFCYVEYEGKVIFFVPPVGCVISS